MSRHVQTLRLDTGRLNLLTAPPLRELREQLRVADEDPETRVLLLLGREDAFSAGLDSKVLAQGGVAAQELLVEMGELLHALYASGTPVVAACRGHAVAAGAMLLLASDLRVGAQGRYRVGFSEVASGLPLPALPVLLARDRLDPRRLQEATLLGRVFFPEEAKSVGFLDRVVPVESLEGDAAAEAALIAERPTDAYASSLASVRGATLDAIRVLLDREREKLEALRSA